MDLTQSYSLPVPALAGLIIVVVIGRAIARTFGSRAKKDDKLMPFAPVGMIGTIRGFSGNQVPFFLLDQARRLGRYSFRLRLPIPGGAYVIGDYELAHEIFKDATTDKPAAIYKNFDEITGRGTIFSSPKNSYWKFVRKATAHAFAVHELSRMVQIATDVAHKWMKKLDSVIEKGDSFDPSKEMIKLTFDVICRAGFEYEPTAEEHERFVRSMEIIFREFGLKQSTNPLRRIFWFLLPEARRAYQHCQYVRDFCAHMLHTYRKNPDKSKNNTLIRLIAENPQFPSDKDRIAEMLTFLVAGHDTTGYTLGSTLVLLAKHKAVLEKLRDELKQCSPDKWHNVEYLQCVVKESMRIMPVTALVPARQTGRSFAHNGEVIPKGSLCFLPLNLIFQNEAVFENADEFVPERWLNATPAMNNSLIPFVVGNRNCLGQYLAKAEIETVLPLLVTNFDFELESEGYPDFFLTLKFANAKLKPKPII